MSKKVKTPESAADWRAEHAWLEADIARVEGERNLERIRRSGFAVASREAEFQKSFEADEALRREGERLEALLANAKQQLVAAETAEREAAERERRQKIEEAYTRQHAAARKVDDAMATFSAAAHEFAASCNEIRVLGGPAPRRISLALMTAAKAAGLRELLELSVPGPALSLENQVSGAARAAGQSTEAA
jgi:hypothetical protein